MNDGTLQKRVTKSIIMFAQLWIPCKYNDATMISKWKIKTEHNK